jgi:hypothetical protein
MQWLGAPRDRCRGGPADWQASIRLRIWGSGVRIPPSAPPTPLVAHSLFSRLAFTAWRLSLDSYPLATPLMRLRWSLTHGVLRGRGRGIAAPIQLMLPIRKMTCARWALIALSVRSLHPAGRSRSHPVRANRHAISAGFRRCTPTRAEMQSSLFCKSGA